MASLLDRISIKGKKSKKEQSKQKKKKKRLTKAEREEKKRKQKEKEIRELILEVSFYVVFLILLITTASNNIDSQAFGFRQSTLSFIDSNDAVAKVRTVGQFWTWMNTSLLPFLYPLRDWDHTLLYGSEHEKLVVTFSSYRVGPLRIRQHRMRDEPCSFDKHFQYLDIRCIYSWSSSYMDWRNNTRTWKAVFFNKTKDRDDGPDHWTPWKYRQWWDIGGLPVMGLFGVYPTGGYVVDIETDKRHDANRIIADLKKLSWIDEYSRFISVEFSLFCPGANMFAMVPVIFEFPQAEIMMGKAHLYPFRLFSYLGGYPSARLACDFLVYMAIVWFATREVYKIAKERRKYFTKFWNILELTNLLLSVTAITLYIGRHVITTYVSKDIGNVGGQYYNFQTLALWNELFSILLGFVCFLSTLQLLHLLRFNKRMSLLAATLKEASKDLLGFSLVFVIMFLAFVSLSCITFGSNLIQYSNVIRSIETLVTVALGSFDYQALIHVNHIFAPIFLFAYMMFIVFILINMLITILNDAFSVVREDFSKQPNDYELVDYIVSRITDFLMSWNPIRIILDRKRDTYKVKAEDHGNRSLSKATTVGKKRQPGLTRVDHRRGYRQQSTFNTDLLRLHNRLDNMSLLVDSFIKTIESESCGIGHFQKKDVSFMGSPFDDCHVLSLSLDESGIGLKEQVVPGVRKVRRFETAIEDADEMDNVVPEIEIARGHHSEVSFDTWDEVDQSIHEVGSSLNVKNITEDSVVLEMSKDEDSILGISHDLEVDIVQSMHSFDLQHSMYSDDDIKDNVQDVDSQIEDDKFEDDVEVGLGQNLESPTKNNKFEDVVFGLGGNLDSTTENNKFEDVEFGHGHNLESQPENNKFEDDAEFGLDENLETPTENNTFEDGVEVGLGQNLDSSTEKNNFEDDAQFGLDENLETPTENNIFEDGVEVGHGQNLDSPTKNNKFQDDVELGLGQNLDSPTEKNKFQDNVEFGLGQNLDSPTVSNKFEDDVRVGRSQDDNIVKKYVRQIELGTFSRAINSPLMDAHSYHYPADENERGTNEGQDDSSSFVTMSDDSEDFSDSTNHPSDPNVGQKMRDTPTQNKMDSSDDVVVDIDDQESSM